MIKYRRDEHRKDKSLGLTEIQSRRLRNLTFKPSDASVDYVPA